MVAQNLDRETGLNPLTSAQNWVDASTEVHASDPISGGRPRAVQCEADGILTMVDDKGVTKALTATADPRPLPYAPYRITAVTGTWYLLY